MSTPRRSCPARRRPVWTAAYAAARAPSRPSRSAGSRPGAARRGCAWGARGRGRGGGHGCRDRRRGEQAPERARRPDGVPARPLQDQQEGGRGFAARRRVPRGRAERPREALEEVRRRRAPGEELQRAGRPSSAPASGRGSARGAAGSAKGNAKTADRRLSVQPSATPLAKGERPPRHSLDSLGGDALCGVADDASLRPAPRRRGSKKCNCKKSKCLKLYCECFAAGAFCDECNCQNCCNTPADAALVAATRHQIELRNPQAFADKITEDGGPTARRGTRRGATARSRRASRSTASASKPACPAREYCKCEGCKNTAGAGPHAGKAAPRAGTARRAPRVVRLTRNGRAFP